MHTLKVNGGLGREAKQSEAGVEKQMYGVQQRGKGEPLCGVPTTHIARRLPSRGYNWVWGTNRTRAFAEQVNRSVLSTLP